VRKLGRRREALLLALVASLSLGLRLFRLDRPGLSHDEALTIYLASEASPKAWFKDVHPPLHYALYRVWLRAFPWRGEEAVPRLPQAFCGSFVPVLLFFLIRPAVGGAALIPAASAAISPFFVRWSRDAWRYGAVPLLALLCTLLFLHSLRGGGRNLALYALSALFAVAYQWALVGVLVAHSLFLLLERPKGGLMPLLAIQGAISLGAISYLRLHMALMGARVAPPPLSEGLRRAALLLFQSESCPVASFPSPISSGWLSDLAFATSVISLPLLVAGLLRLWGMGVEGRAVALVVLVQVGLLCLLALLGMAPNPWYAALTGGLTLAAVQVGALEGRLPTSLRLLWWPPFALVNLLGALPAASGAREVCVDYEVVALRLAEALGRRAGAVVAFDSLPPFYGPRTAPVSLYLSRPARLLPSPWTWSTALGAFEGPDGRPLPEGWRESCALSCRGRSVVAVWVVFKGYGGEGSPPLRRLLLRTHRPIRSRKIFSTPWVGVWLEEFEPLPARRTKTAAPRSR